MRTKFRWYRDFTRSNHRGEFYYYTPDLIFKYFYIDRFANRVIKYNEIVISKYYIGVDEILGKVREEFEQNKLKL